MKTFPSTFTWRWLLLALLFGLALGAGLMTWQHHKQLQSSVAWQQQWLQSQQDLELVRLHNQSLETQLTLELATQDALQQSLGQKQQELGRFQEQLAFYEHLLPLSGTGAVQVRALELEPQGQTLHYRLLLQRSAGLPRFNGHIQFRAHGQQDADSVNIVLTSAGEEPSAPTEIEFDQFLRTTGLLQLPSGLNVETVTLDIYEGKQLRATHKIDLVPLSAAAENH